MHNTDARKSSESFGKIKEVIILKIQKMLELNTDSAESIESRVNTVFTAPTIPSSSKIDTNERAREDHQFDIEYETKFKRHMVQEEEFNRNWVKAYALIWEAYCSKETQIVVKETSTFDVEIRNDPLGLLNNVEKLMHTPQRAKYPPLTLVEVPLNI